MTMNVVVNLSNSVSQEEEKVELNAFMFYLRSPRTGARTRARTRTRTRIDGEQRHSSFI